MADPRGDILALDALTLRDRIASGALSALDLAEACLARIQALEPEIKAWAWLDPEFVRAQARGLDAHRAAGRPIGPLHGVPVAVKDIIDTARIPTENGCPVDAGRVPERDAFVVEQLRAAGALILGKTVTTELAFLDPAPTLNPHAPDRTPGGSSSGSAAAVACGMVPLALGTQTGGSVIRPAAFCGVTGFKPTFGAIPRRGILAQAPSLDTVGVMARTPADAALLAEVLFGHDAEDTATAPAPHPQLLKTVQAGPPLPPVFAMIRPPGWAEAEPQTRAAFEELAEALGDQAFWVDLPSAFEQALEPRQAVHFGEMARCYYSYGKTRDRIGPNLQGAIAAGEALLARDYIAALDWPHLLNAALGEIFERADAILCPAAPGPAPLREAGTGNPIFNGIWTFCGTPAVTIPALTSEEGLPMGVQLVGARGNDGRLLRSAQWLLDWVTGAAGTGEKHDA